ncbi:MAG TPA: TenA family protein [Acidimicrobiales bacterium]|nr:TenA family protein [Acidimicrobiales bacterium]
MTPTASTASVAHDLWAASSDIAGACLDHPFVRGIASGDLARDTFVTYVGQDAIFLESFARAYAFCIAKAPDRAAMESFRALLDGVFDELRLHGSYAEQWGAPLNPPPLPSTSAYTEFLLEVATDEEAVAACAAMTPCMRLYAWLGQQLAPVTAPGSPYKEWVDTYSSPDFEELASTLEALLDRLVRSSNGDAGAGDVAAHYRRAMELELAFFEGAYRS